MSLNTTSHLPQRLTALVVSVLVALAAGTPYLYGVFSPQLIQRVGLTISDSATISLATNLGSGLGGLPAGLVIDHYGPHISIMIGSTGIFLGYLALHIIYQRAIASLPLICMSMALVGFGSITCFFATLKAAQANFPKHRGTAGAFPVSAFGLAATIFSVIAATFFSGNSGGLLLFLSLCCGTIAFVGSFFIHVYLDQQDPGDEEQQVQAISVPQVSSGFSDEESPLVSRSNSSYSLAALDESGTKLLNGKTLFSDSFRGTKPLLGGKGASVSSSTLDSDSTLRSIPELPKSETLLNTKNNLQTGLAPGASKRVPIIQISQPQIESRPTRPLDVIRDRLTDRVFLTHFLAVSLSSGICQMYIYSVGFIATAQYYYDPEHGQTQLFARAVAAITGGAPISGGAAALQAVQVSVISLASFSGRLIAGFLSDYIHKKFHISRLWIVAATSVALAVGQFINIHNVNNPHLVSIASALIGGCYGLAFGTYPAVIADQFGTKTFSTSWGLICVGPLTVLFSLNKFFGYLYDSNSDPATGICYKGNECYKGAFEISFSLCFLLLVVVLILISIDKKKR
ncbi:MFS general substrate transporter [Suhomyces tanzawaensis NRRL Y-17324]|uniref:MFS general substrate transporter n=1 Tax=Suhomyces tanzawaensis NRRL Y-17324 TaxID=984487 RepID=A0A1E4SFA1_9ASCO|nr:MFS general substrate transporter [Suhomyces tanzawaensis NRRL Y-17324]ODV78153.1 MFS general substrate transporter [Suhomyces tanzawaensis NRRL Y-17324]